MFVVLRKRDVGLVIGEISSSVWVEDFTRALFSREFWRAAKRFYRHKGRLSEL